MFVRRPVRNVLYLSSLFSSVSSHQFTVQGVFRSRGVNQADLGTRPRVDSESTPRARTRSNGVHDSYTWRRPLPVRCTRRAGSHPQGRVGRGEVRDEMPHVDVRTHARTPGEQWTAGRHVISHMSPDIRAVVDRETQLLVCFRRRAVRYVLYRNEHDCVNCEMNCSSNYYCCVLSF